MKLKSNRARAFALLLILAFLALLAPPRPTKAFAPASDPYYGCVCYNDGWECYGDERYTVCSYGTREHPCDGRAGEYMCDCRLGCIAHK